jgi:hypothetical protein
LEIGYDRCREGAFGMKKMSFKRVVEQLKILSACSIAQADFEDTVKRKNLFIKWASEYEAGANILENLSKLKTFTRPQYGAIGTRDDDVAKQIEIWESIFGVDTCGLCKGASGAVPGNGNIINGQVVCDYCSVKTSKEP